MEAKSWLQSAFDKRWSEKRTAAALAPVQAPPDMAAGPVRTAQSCPCDPGAHAGSACASEEGTYEEPRCAARPRACAGPYLWLSAAITTVILGVLVGSDGGDGGKKQALGAPTKKVEKF